MKNTNIRDISIKLDATIQQAMQAIGKGEIGVAFVLTESGTFNRLLTDGDIRRALLDGHGLQSRIEVIPFHQAVVVDEDMSLDDISVLFDDKIRLIPVLDKDHHVVDYHLYDKRRHIAVAKPLLDDEELQLVSECIITGWVSSGGPFVSKFEQLVAEFCNVKYGIACSSGTAALHLTLLAAGIGYGDEVIVPTLTFISTANAVTYTGAKPVFVDSESSTWNIDPDKIKEAITSRTKAIIPVHLYGHPADMDPINTIAKENNLLVIEDSAEAQGAKYKGEHVGSMSDMSILSFFGNKIITTGEGGMVITNNLEFANKCRLYRDHGMSTKRRYWHDVIGYNYRMTNIQAALGVAQMGKIGRIIKRKKEIAKQYEKHLKNIPGITLPTEMPWANSVYWLYTIMIDEGIVGISIDQIMASLKEAKIDSRPVFPPIHKQPVYKTDQELPVAENISSSGISLPSAPEIRDEDIAGICEVIRNVTEVRL